MHNKRFYVFFIQSFTFHKISHLINNILKIYGGSIERLLKLLRTIRNFLVFAYANLLLEFSKDL